MYNLEYDYFWTLQITYKAECFSKNLNDPKHQHKPNPSETISLACQWMQMINDVKMFLAETHRYSFWLLIVSTITVNEEERDHEKKSQN